jgi:hypothetical protein
MIDGLKRIVRSPAGGGDPWDADRELEPEAEVDFEIPGENTVLVSQAQAFHRYDPTDSSAVEYQRNLVLAAIEQGGKFNDHQIPIPWLRTILAGLEGRDVEPDEVWKDPGTPEPLEPPRGPEPPSFYEFFPVEREAGPTQS